MRTGETATDIYYILSGSVTVLMEDEHGQEFILSYLGPGEFFGELGLFDDSQRRSASVLARSECQLAVIDYPTFRNLSKRMPGLSARLTAQIAHRLRATNENLSSLAFLDVTGRIARVLLDLARDSEAITHPDGMLVRVTREELGRLVSCSREMAGKVLNDLRRQGLIQAQGRNIVIRSQKGSPAD